MHDLVLETLSSDGVWNSYEVDVDDANNTLSYDFTDLGFTKITASSVNASLTVEEIAKNYFVKVYPNSTTDKLIIASKNIKNSILYNINGQKVLETRPIVSCSERHWGPKRYGDRCRQ